MTPEELLTAPAHPQVSALLETPRRQMASLGRLSSFGRKNDEPKPD